MSHCVVGLMVRTCASPSPPLVERQWRESFQKNDDRDNRMDICIKSECSLKSILEVRLAHASANAHACATKTMPHVVMRICAKTVNNIIQLKPLEKTMHSIISEGASSVQKSSRHPHPPGIFFCSGALPQELFFVVHTLVRKTGFYCWNDAAGAFFVCKIIENNSR